ncbi:alpha/beta hydrolase [Streptomyces olindensis]|uniref:Alpha/beta hydrolase n=1 Tax=Streptomyces olindensis TaxID=358823 RepID=A0ABV2Y4I8_9ACTN
MTHAGPAVPVVVHDPRTTTGTAHALVFAPVTPTWDEGAFFAPVIETLTGAAGAGAGAGATAGPDPAPAAVGGRAAGVTSAASAVRRGSGTGPGARAGAGSVVRAGARAEAGARTGTGTGPRARAAAGARGGLRVTVVDTLALLDEDVRTLGDLVARWRALLPEFGPVDLLCGNALGGAVAQGLLPYVAPETGVLLVSGPARSDALLEQRLTEIADLAATGHTDAALALLHHRVLPDGTPAPRTVSAAVATSRPAPRPTGRPTAEAPNRPTSEPTPRNTPAQRLDGGLRLLCGIDLTPAVEAHPGPLLHLVGGRSQLVTRRHTAAAPHHRVHVVPDAGMRPHTDQPAEVSALIETFLREKGLT